MTDEQINTAIAEACGWTQIEQHPPDDTLYGQHPSCTDEVNKYYEYPIPNYCNDLNAMHEAEKVLDRTHSWHGEEHHWNAEEAYMGHITDIIARDSGQKTSDDWQFLCATACQRAEAFLHTLGKWEEVQG